MSAPFDFKTAQTAAVEEMGLTNRPVIRIVAGQAPAAASAVEDALILGDAPLYQRGGLCRPFTTEAPTSSGGTTRVPCVVPVTEPMLVDHTGRVADLEKFDSRSESWKPCELPSGIAKIVLSRVGELEFPPLAGVIVTPTLRPDGSILSAAGYDERTRLLLIAPLRLPPIPKEPTKVDAVDALALLDGLLNEFPFANAASRSVALSGLLTAVARGAMTTAPMHVYSAHMAGTGKSYLDGLKGALVLGDHVPVLSIGKTEEETEKRLSAALMAGRSLVSIDNVNGELGGDFLCQAIERPIISPRVLGQSTLVEIENRATFSATGNNIRITGDMTRRAILCQLDADVERPEQRQFEGNPFAAIMANRGKYVAAALTVVRAYAVAGYPEQRPALASFEQWSKVIRSSLVWLGQADPCDTMSTAQASDPERAALQAVLSAWIAASPDKWLLARELIQIAMQQGQWVGFEPSVALREALMEVAEHNKGREVCGRRLGRWLADREGRIVAGMKIESRENSHSKQKEWRIKLV